MVSLLLVQIHQLWTKSVVLDTTHLSISAIYPKGDRYVMFLRGGWDTTFLIYTEIDSSLSNILTSKAYKFSLRYSQWRYPFQVYIDSIGGGYIGHTIISSDSIDTFKVALFKFDSTGNLIWAKTYNYQTDRNYEFIYQALRVVRLSDGYLVFSVTDTFDARIDSIYSCCPWAYADEDPVIIRIDNNGNVLWSKILKWELSELAIGDVIYAGGDSMIVGGWYYDFDNPPYNAMIGIIDTLGNVVWMKALQSDKYIGVRNFVILDSNRIFGITGQGLGGWVNCGGILFDGNLNPLRCGIDIRDQDMYSNGIFTYDVRVIGDKIFSYSCVVDTGITKVRDKHTPKILKVDSTYAYFYKYSWRDLIGGIYKSVYTGEMIRICTDSIGFVPAYPCAIFPADITDSITVVSFTLTPQDIPYTYIGSVVLNWDTLCFRNVVSAKEGKGKYICSAKYEIYTVSGRLVRKGEGKEDLKDLPKGVYMIRRGGRVYKVIRR